MIFPLERPKCGKMLGGEVLPWTFVCPNACLHDSNRCILLFVTRRLTLFSSDRLSTLFQKFILADSSWVAAKLNILQWHFNKMNFGPRAQKWEYFFIKNSPEETFNVKELSNETMPIFLIHKYFLKMFLSK